MSVPTSASPASLLQLHASVLLFAFTALFGKWLAVHPMAIVFGRVTFASLALFCLLKLRGSQLKLDNWQDAGSLVLNGALLALHWIAFFASVQASNVAICLVALSTAPVLVVLLESLLLRHERLTLPNLMIALVSLTGVVIATPTWNLASGSTRGILWGLVASLAIALMMVRSGKHVRNYEPLLVAFCQIFVPFLLLLPVMLFLRPEVTPRDIGLLALLGIVFTGGAQLLFMQSLQGLPTRLVSLITASMEVVYGVLLAAVFLHEVPGTRTILGGIILIATTIYASIRPRDVKGSTPPVLPL